jgi:hypothetical protein
MGIFSSIRRAFGGDSDKEATAKKPSKPDDGKDCKAPLSNSEMIERLTHNQSLEGQRQFGTVLRGADVLEDSGVLDQFKQLQDIEVPESERDRTIDDDAVLVMQGLSKLTPKEIEDMKEAAYNHEEGQAAVKEALEVEHYGSANHKEYGALVERLTGGVLSAEEAMAMNPTGGLIGPGSTILRHLDGIDSLKRHALRHDATGFLINRFGVGPGYGSKTSFIGRDSTDPLAGQILGWARELLDGPSDFEDSSSVATSGRFNELPADPKA